MTTLTVGATTTALTSQMTMANISNAEYSMIEDINVTITGYAIGTAETSANPEEAWAACKQAGDIE